MQPKKYILSLTLLVVCTSISSCNSSNYTSRELSVPTPNSTASPRPQTSQVETQPFLTQPSPSDEAPTSANKAVSGKTTTVTLYISDTQCQDYVAKAFLVSADEPINEAVSKVLQERETADFSLAGYRVNVNNDIATIDLRIAPDSKRQIPSLSSCEQFALFGSLRKTLTSNGQWKIKEVRLTEKGEEISP
ncbi:GerMN domain-containing protein [Trichormus azollae]|jgi:hypothetical protein|uniref:GerMN domain-containing protein n=1 Tax=Nostoc azollae (strain 0708) TaxID=551115 RepID=D7E4C1_NOSA0|nr:GerMN domain-containing protein [Trichormus azollae]ADI65339.1 conserved hypothetical protein ['Nostoc azollae' 0708]